MDTRLAVRPTSAGLQSVLRADPAPVQGAVSTDLAAAQAVTAAAAATAAHNDTARPPLSNPMNRGDIVLDPHSREVIYRTPEMRETAAWCV